jgi:hypothetical protein
MATKYTKWLQNIPIGSKIDQTAQNMPTTSMKFNQIGIFGLKIYDLATLRRPQCSFRNAI